MRAPDRLVRLLFANRGSLAARIHLDRVVAVPHQRQAIRQRDARDAAEGIATATAKGK